MFIVRTRNSEFKCIIKKTSKLPTKNIIFININMNLKL